MPDEDGIDDGGGDLGLVLGVVGLGEDGVVRAAFGGELDSKGRTGEGVEAGQRDAREGDVEAGVEDVRIERTGQREAARDEGGLRGFPGQKAGRGGRSERGGEEMDA